MQSPIPQTVLWTESHQLRIRELIRLLPGDYQAFPAVAKILLERVRFAGQALAEWPELQVLGQATLSENGRLVYSFLEEFGSDPALWPHWARRHSCG